jgi:type I restriction enzyme S subunit
VVNTEDLPDGFQMTELGPLPKEWRVVRLGEVAEFGKNRTMQKPKASLIPFMPMSLLPEDTIYISQWEMRRDKEIRSGIPIQNGDFLLAKITPSFENGKQGIVKDIPGGWGYASTEVIPIRPYPELHTEYLAFYLKQPSIRQELAGKMEGSTGRQRLPKMAVQQLLIPLPPLAEQRAIAHVLRTVQRAKEATEGVIAALKELKKSLMRHVFTYGPVPVDQADQVRLKETELGPLPEEWEVVRLGALFEIQQGKALSPRARAGGRKRPFLRTANVLWGRVDLSVLDEMHFDEEEEARLALVPGDLLVCEGGDIGRTAIWEGQLPLVLYQNHLHRLRPARAGVDPLFYMYWMQAAWLLLGLYGGAGNKTTIPNLSRSRLAAFPVPLPPLPEQRAIAETLRTVDRKIEAEESRKRGLEALFKTLLHDLMTAKIRVKGFHLPELE